MYRDETTQRVFHRINELRKQQDETSDLLSIMELQIRIDNLKNILTLRLL